MITNPDKYCFDLGANHPAKCFDSKLECESNREAMLSGDTAFRVASECYKIMTRETDRAQTNCPFLVLQIVDFRNYL